MQEILERLADLRTLSGNAQISYLNNVKTDLLKDVLLYTYDPHKKYKIDEGKYNKISFTQNEIQILTQQKWEEFKEILNYLSQIPSAKDEDVRKVKTFIENSSQPEFLKMVLAKDLKLNMSIKKFQKVWENFCIEPQVQLAQMYEGKDFNNGLYSRKFDGKRMYILNGLPFSRANKICSIPPVQHILDQIPENIKKDYVLDGECLYFKNGKEDFQKGISLTSSKNRTDDCDNIYYVIFDVIPKHNFLNNESRIPFSEEYVNIIMLFTNPSVPQVERFHSLLSTKFKNIYIAKQTKNREELEQYRLESNWEGLMYRNADSPYEYKRSKNLLKIKSFHDGEYLVDSIELGTKPMLKSSNINENSEPLYEDVECVAAIHFKHKGFDVKCGSGFSDEQRIYFMQHPEDIVGKVVKIKYFEETQNQQGELSLRFPTFLCFRDKDTMEEVIS